MEREDAPNALRLGKVPLRRVSSAVTRGFVDIRPAPTGHIGNGRVEVVKEWPSGEVAGLFEVASIGRQNVPMRIRWVATANPWGAPVEPGGEGGERFDIHSVELLQT